MTKILGLSGSLRKLSFNSGLLRAARDVAPEGVEIQIGSIAGVPLYNGDEEDAHGTPAAVGELNAQLAAADGLLLVTPEYNNGIPGVFKNAIDWMSRGEGGKNFKNKPVAVIGATPGNLGTVLSQNSWLPTLRLLGANQWHNGRLMVSGAGDLFNDKAELTDEKTRERLTSFISDFAATLK